MHLPNPLLRSRSTPPAAEAALANQQTYSISTERGKPRKVIFRLTAEAARQQQCSSGVQGHSDKHALGPNPKAQCAFKILMIHEVLQFALRIAFRCVLHRCGIQDIHCSKLYYIELSRVLRSSFGSVYGFMRYWAASRRSDRANFNRASASRAKSYPTHRRCREATAAFDFSTEHGKPRKVIIRLTADAARHQQRSILSPNGQLRHLGLIYVNGASDGRASGD